MAWGRVPHRAGSGVEVGHLREGVGLEGGTADEGAVDVRLGHELLDVAGLGGAAVEDAGGVRGGVAVVGAEGLADRAADLLGVLGGGGLAGADGPDGLVGDDDLGDVLGAPALEGGADFIKTSTGKTRMGATPEAVAVMLDALRRSGRAAGIKPSGGIRGFSVARRYFDMAEAAMGTGWVGPATFRLGASSLLIDLLAVTEGQPSAESQEGY